MADHRSGTDLAQAAIGRPFNFVPMSYSRLASIFLPALLAGFVAAQDAPVRTIEVQFTGAARDTIYLANYYGNKLYYSDTAVADAKGLARFKSTRGYKAGVYAVVVPGPKYFELLVNEPVIKLTTDKNDLLGKLQIRESKENEIFIGYIRFLNARKEEGDALRARMDQTMDPIAKGSLREQMTALDAQVKAYQQDILSQHPTTLAASLVRMSMAVDLEEPRKPDGSMDSTAAYYQYRAHFWDNVDFTDDRIVRVPVFHNKLEEYMSKVVPQAPDTINRLADQLIARSKEGSEVFQYLVQFITNKYQTSEIMGMDGVFVHMALTYYCPAPNKASRAFWMDDEKLEKLCERARKMAPLTLGRKAPAISLTDSTEQNWINFYNLPAEYVVLLFWDPHCGHCKKEMPNWYKVYQEEMKALGIEIFAVAKAVDESLMRDWKKFIRENNLNWVNVGLTKNIFEEAKKDARKFIPKHTTLESLNYAETYDVYSTPKVFIVDGERKLVGKQLTAEQVVDLVKQLRSRTKTKG
jgi:thiol-disulfide isomerase/thioredoxin